MKSINSKLIRLVMGMLLISATVTARAYSSSQFTSDTTSTQNTVAPPSKLKSINLFNAGNYLILECTLNGKSAYFMVDTGASLTVLHNKVAKLYDFQVLGRKGQQTTGFGGNQSSVEIAIGASLNFGDQNVSIGFLAQDLSKIIRLIQQNSKVRIAGIIGTDLLKRLGCRLDLGNKVLHFVR